MLEVNFILMQRVEKCLTCKPDDFKCNAICHYMLIYVAVLETYTSTYIKGLAVS